MHIAILNDVAAELEKELDHHKNKLPLYAAIDNYHGRIETSSLVWKIRESKRTGSPSSFLS